MTEKLPAWLSPSVIAIIIHAAVFGAGGGVLYASVQSDLKSQRAALLSQSDELRNEQEARRLQREKIEAAMAAQDSRVRAVEISASGTAADVRSIQAGISRIENTLDKLVGGR